MDIEKSLAICEAAMPGPWHGDGQGMYIFDADNLVVAEVRGWGHLSVRYGEERAAAIQEANAAFIADARENFPEALRIIKRVSEIFQVVSNSEPVKGEGVLFYFLPTQLAELRSLLSLDGKDGA